MYETNKLSQDALFTLESIIYSGIIHKMESLRFTIDTWGVNPAVHKQYSALSELVNWYCENIITSGAYLEDERRKLYQLILFKSNR